MNKIRHITKFVLILTYILFYVFNLIILRFFYIGRNWAYRKAIYPYIKFWSKNALKLIGISVTTKGSTIKNAENFLVVSNHLSYLDIIIVTSQFPTNFVTSMEIKETPVLGFLTEVGGCLYVERRNKENLHKEINEITEALAKGLNVTIFPEATSTNGEGVLRFRRPLYNAAIHSRKMVKPICINYKMLNGALLNRNNRDVLFWYGGMSFLPHLWQLMAQDKIEVEIKFLEDLPIMEITEAALLAEESYRLVTSAYIPVI